MSIIPGIRVSSPSVLYEYYTWNKSVISTSGSFCTLPGIRASPLLLDLSVLQQLLGKVVGELIQLGLFPVTVATVGAGGRQEEEEEDIWTMVEVRREKQYSKKFNKVFRRSLNDKLRGGSKQTWPETLVQWANSQSSTRARDPVAHTIHISREE